MTERREDAVNETEVRRLLREWREQYGGSTDTKGQPCSAELEARTDVHLAQPDAPQPASAEVESTKVADLKRQLAAERDGRMRAEALVDDMRRANESLRSETADTTWLEDELVEVMRIVAPSAKEDNITHAMLVTAIRRLMEADTENYEALLARWQKRHGGGNQVMK